MNDIQPQRLYQLPPTPLARVLVVDDIAEITDMLSAHLDARGYEIIRAYSGRQAIDKALFFHPHVIVLNLTMPGINGDAVAGYMKAHPATKGAKIIMTSGHTHLEKYCLELGVDAFLAKPFTMRQLEATISRLLA